ncbi:LytR/AlgR family response regulator transcription factor [Jeotgalicoccus sp. FSL K6-3177]|uniref:LytR/AlgR family response regulator transcription factor n=1 Tax=Jeotgalicoccus sp. FSL K6-3177 TaxID=2921494 RepID=UPI0030FD3194
MNQIIKTLVADDEKYSREELKYLLGTHPAIQVSGEAATGREALAKIITDELDLLLLDIDMPEMSGIELAATLKKMKNPPLIIFTTAYSEYAVEAFKVQAVDYLLKPVDETELAEAIAHVSELLDFKREPARGKLAVGGEESITYLNPAEVLFVSRENNTTAVVSSKGIFSSRKTLKELESRLLSHSFFRVHKSYLVNTEVITEMTPWFNGAFQLTLEGTDVQIPVSRNYVKSLRDHIEL